ncbi:MAG: TIGR03086 family metal-binding protein [Actinomycetes bacterium]
MSDTESLQTFTASLGAFGELVTAVADDQWDASTPCTDWDVRTLVNHVLVEQLWAEPMLTGRTVEDVGERLDGDQLGTDPAAAWERAASESLAQFTKEGVLDSTVNSSRGPLSARQYLGEMTFDLIVHRWDFGQAIDKPQQLSNDELSFVQSVIDAMAPMAADLIGAGIFASPVKVASDADRQTSLLARLGRQG